MILFSFSLTHRYTWDKNLTSEENVFYDLERFSFVQSGYDSVQPEIIPHPIASHVYNKTDQRHIKGTTAHDTEKGTQNLQK
jgi:hypothetical protein